MKNLHKGSLGTLAIAPLLFFGGTQDPGVASALQTEVDRQAVVIQKMEGKLDELGKLAEKTNGYLIKQSRAASSLVKTLATSEEQGFTAGINHDSRVTLLDGLRGYLSSQQKAVPGAKPAPKEKD